MTGTEIYTELRSLLNAAGDKHYQRIKLADQLLKDKAWVRSPEWGGGDEDKAIDLLERTCFADLCGLITLPQLLDILHHIPDIREWQRCRFNLRQMWADWRAKQKPTPAPRAERVRKLPVELTPPLQFPEMTPSKQRKEYERAVRIIETDAEKIQRLTAENTALRQENEQLKAEIARLKRSIGEVLKSA